MHPERRATDNITEPQTIDELVRGTYKATQEIKKVLFGNGQPGLTYRMTTIETMIRVLGWVVGVGIPAISAILGWMILFKRPE